MRRTFVAAPSMVQEVRHIAEAAALQWGFSRDVADDVALVVTEMVTNAVDAAPYEKICLRMSCSSEELTVQVWDPSPVMPARRIPDIDVKTAPAEGAPDPGGWGLGIIESLSQRCGHRKEHNGKTVFAVLTEEGHTRAHEADT